MCCPLAISAADGSNVGAKPPRRRPRRSMRGDLLRRVRWDIVAATAAALVVAIHLVGAIVGAAAPRLPSDRAVPLVSDEPTPAPALAPTTPRGPARATPGRRPSEATARKGTRRATPSPRR